MYKGNDFFVSAVLPVVKLPQRCPGFYYLSWIREEPGGEPRPGELKEDVKELLREAKKPEEFLHEYALEDARNLLVAGVIAEVCKSLPTVAWKEE